MNPSLSCLSGFSTVNQGRARGKLMPEKGVTVLHGWGRKAYDRPSCAPDQASYHQVSNQKGLMEIYSPQGNIFSSNVMLFRSNFPLNSGLLLQVYNNVLTILSFISSSLIFFPNSPAFLWWNLWKYGKGSDDCLFQVMI